MASFSVSIEMGRRFDEIQRAVAKTGKITQGIRDTLFEAARSIKEPGERAWPRSYNRRGEIVTGAAYAKLARQRQHNIPKPSAESFHIEERTGNGKISAVILSRAAWAYKIRSFQVGETSAQRSNRFDWKRGTSVKAYDAQTRLGQKRHAWSVLFLRPWRKAKPEFARRINDVLGDV